jgi:hypothetical protein
MDCRRRDGCLAVYRIEWQEYCELDILGLLEDGRPTDFVVDYGALGTDTKNQLPVIAISSNELS